MNGSEPNDKTHTSTVPGTATPVAIPRKIYSFLNPPIEPDEIGRLGQYRILRLLGAGGMGYVFEAEEVSLHRRVAIKILRPELCAEKESRERFLREARAAASINSDHVVTIYQIVDSEMPYLVMQFLAGESLQTRIERPNPIILQTALEIARQTAEGLAAAHALGLIHRDIKPANLWLAKSDEKRVGTILDTDSANTPSYFRVKLLDFGLVRRTVGETSLTSTGFIVGTPNYMSPEQASGISVDHRADIFSLGCVLYTVLTGELPFPGISAMAVMMSLANRTPPPVNLKNPGVPKEVADFVSKLLEKNPSQRPQSAPEVVAKLEELLARPTENPSLFLELPQSQIALAAASFGEIETVQAQKGETRTPTMTAMLTQEQPIPHTSPRRSSRVWVVGSLIALLLGSVLFMALRKPDEKRQGDTVVQPVAAPEPIAVGILHSQTGRMAPLEKPVIESTLFAIEELNAAGGVLGRPVKYILEDGHSEPERFASAAEKLLTVDKVVALFGSWTSTSRRAVRPIVERNNGLLFFPAQTEGMELSPRIVYLGPASNQHLIPAIDFLTDTLKKRKIFVVGSDSVYPRMVAQIIKDHLTKKGKPELFVGEAFLTVGSNTPGVLVSALQREEPDAIVNAIYGTPNVEFFHQLRKQGYTSDKTATVSVTISQTEVKSMDPATLAGDYLAASYFEAVERPQGQIFVQKIKRKYGKDTTVSDSMAAAYCAVNQWAQAVNQSGTTNPDAVLKTIRGQEFEGPRGRDRIDPDNLYTWLPARIAKIRPDGEVEILTDTGLNTRIAPVPYPDTRSRESWDGLLKSWYFKWDGKWQAPLPLQK